MTARLDRLLDVYIEGSISREEYAERKEAFVRRKTVLAAEITEIERDGASRFKPLRDFISASRQARSVALGDDITALRDFHRKIGSNLVLASEIVGNQAEDKSAVAPLARSSEHRGRMSPDGDNGKARVKRSRPTGGAAAVRHGRHCGHRPLTDKDLCKSRIRPNQSRSGFIPILPDSEIAAAFGVKPFRSLGSRTDPILHVQFPMPWAIFAHAARKSGEISNWRASLMYARTEHDPEYAPDTDQFKLKITYIIPNLA